MEKELEFEEIINIIQNHRQNAYRKINEELVMMYFEVGKYLSEKVKSEDWGSKAIDKLVLTIKLQYPYLKGFNRAGLYRMIQFYEIYRDNQKVRTLLAQLSWSNNLLIIQETKTFEAKEFYIHLCMKNNYSYRELKRQIRSHYHQMIQFYEIYKDNIIVSPLVTQLSWTNNLLILRGAKTIEEKEFYIRLWIKNNYLSRELNRQI